jgi:hypothetical protein
MFSAYLEAPFRLYTFDSQQLARVTGTTLAYAKAVMGEAHVKLGKHVERKETGGFEADFQAGRPSLEDVRKTGSRLGATSLTYLALLDRELDRVRVYGLDDDESLFPRDLQNELSQKGLRAFYWPRIPVTLSFYFPLPTITSSQLNDHTGEVQMRAMNGRVEERLRSGKYIGRRGVEEDAGDRLKLSERALERTSFGETPFVFELAQGRCSEFIKNVPSRPHQNPLSED